jgi:twitching motility protein PilT
MYWVAVALVDSLLTAMVRANGDALVMHVGEKPIVVAGSKTIDLSTHGLNLGAMIGMLGQLLPADARASLEEFGAVEHRLPPHGTDRFTVVAARGGDDIWIEIRRRRDEAAEPADEAPETPVATAEAPASASMEEAAHDVDTARDAEAVHELSTADPRAEAIQEAAAPPTDSSEPVVEVVAVTVVEAEVPLDLAAPGESAPGTNEAAQADATGYTDTQESAAAIDPAAKPAPEPNVAQPAPEAESRPGEAGPEPVLADASVPGEEAALVAETPVEAIAPQEVAEVRVPEAVRVMAAAGAAGYSDTPMTPMDFTPPPLAVPAAPSAPATPPPAASVPAGGFTPGSSDAPTAPVTRTVRIEVPPRAMATRLSATDRLLRAASGQAASELFLISQARPYIRVDGEIRVLEEEAPLQAAEVEAMLAEVTPEPWREPVRRGDPAEWLMEFADVGRVRCATFRDHRGPGAIFHFSSTHAATADQLGLDANARLLATEPDGLVVVASPAGSDKSTIVAAFVDIINRSRADYVITLEPQVRVTHEHHQALVSQREVGSEVDRSVAMARAALRENPDVLVLEDVAAGELVSIALDAAKDGRLVVVSVEVGSAADAVQRLIELVPAERRSAARLAMAQSFRGAVAQLLLRKAAGGRIAAREVLAGTGAVCRLIADGNLPELSATIEAGRGADMSPMADALVGYVKSGVVDVREAVRRAPDRARLLAALKAAGVDTAAVDRVA